MFNMLRGESEKRRKNRKEKQSKSSGKNAPRQVVAKLIQIVELRHFLSFSYLCRISCRFCFPCHHSGVSFMFHIDFDFDKIFRSSFVARCQGKYCSLRKI